MKCSRLFKTISSHSYRQCRPFFLQVVLGGGRRHWLPKVSRDPEPPGEEGRRLDGRNLIADWLREKKRRGLRAEYVWNRAEMERVDPRRVDHLLGT
jgi:alkaline phosphatase